MATEEIIQGKEYIFYDKSMIQTIQVRVEYICFYWYTHTQAEFGRSDPIQLEINAKTTIW